MFECCLMQVLDFGSGKGYLGNQLVLQHGIPVLGIDAQKGNTHSALSRTNILNKQWKGVQRNADFSSRGIKLTKKEKKKLKQNESLDNPESHAAMRSDSCDRVKYVPCTMFIDKNTDFTNLVSEFFPEISKHCEKSSVNSNTNDINISDLCDKCCKLKTSQNEITKMDLHVDDSSLTSGDAITSTTTTKASSESVNCSNDISDLNTSYSKHTRTDGEAPRLLLTGLHTCGNLASTSVDIFATSSTCKCLCNVGCCYHLLDEKFSERNDEAFHEDLGALDEGMVSYATDYNIEQKLCFNSP